MKRIRKCLAGDIIHVYQRAVYGYNLFYALEDRVVFLTMLYHFSRRWNIKILGVCLMVDHVHILLIAESKSALSSFVNSYSSMYAKMFNASCGRMGQLFAKSFGSAPKVGDKKIRTAIAYLFNNPVEKKMCTRAEEYIWSLLAFANSSCPFSAPVHRKSKWLSYAMKEVCKCFDNESYLTYSILKRIMRRLSTTEIEQLTDYIISLFNPIDYAALSGYYGTYENMLIAINSNTGSEYDIKEEYNSYSDYVYYRVIDFMSKSLKLDIKRVLSYTDEEKIKLAMALKLRVNVTDRQLCKLLHIKARECVSG